MLGIRSQNSQTAGGLISLKLPDREVIVSMSHVSIEPEQIDRAVKDPQVGRWVGVVWCGMVHASRS